MICYFLFTCLLCFPTFFNPLFSTSISHFLSSFSLSSFTLVSISIHFLIMLSYLFRSLYFHLHISLLTLLFFVLFHPLIQIFLLLLHSFIMISRHLVPLFFPFHSTSTHLLTPISALVCLLYKHHHPVSCITRYYISSAPSYPAICNPTAATICNPTPDTTCHVLHSTPRSPLSRYSTPNTQF